MQKEDLQVDHSWHRKKKGPKITGTIISLELLLGNMALRPRAQKE